MNAYIKKKSTLCYLFARKRFFTHQLVLSWAFVYNSQFSVLNQLSCFDLFLFLKPKMLIAKERSATNKLLNCVKEAFPTKLGNTTLVPVLLFCQITNETDALDKFLQNSKTCQKGRAVVATKNNTKPQHITIEAYNSRLSSVEQ